MPERPFLTYKPLSAWGLAWGCAARRAWDQCYQVQTYCEVADRWGVFHPSLVLPLLNPKTPLPACRVLWDDVRRRGGQPTHAHALHWLQVELSFPSTAFRKVCQHNGAWEEAVEVMLLCAESGPVPRDLWDAFLSHALSTDDLDTVHLALAFCTKGGYTPDCAKLEDLLMLIASTPTVPESD
eukprot:Sspe_Gene.48814::Locus_25738_Transcript_3_4_Confidence_0.667_Length_747::g.48814::m.48814